MKIDNRYLNNIILPITFDRPMVNFQLSQLLIKYMVNNKAIGLAANQVGYNKRVFVMGIQNRIWTCFNPEIIASDMETISDFEGCLSFPKKVVTVARPKQIHVKYYDHAGNLTEESLSGLAARCFQHELDHLNGITMFKRTEELNYV